MRLLQDLLDRQCATRAAQPFLVHGGVRWAFGESRAQALTVAWRLSEAGVQPGDRVLVHASNEAGVVAALFGCWYAGAVAVPLNPGVKPYHLRHVIADCRPSAMVVPRGASGFLAGSGLPAVVADGLAPAAGSLPPPRSADGGDLACLIYTSGSSGMPKAVVCPHDRMIFAVRAIGHVLGYRCDDRVFSCLPVSFDYGLYQIFLCLLAGACLQLDGDASAGPALLRRLEETEATIFPVVPSLAGTLLRLIRRAGGHRLKLRLITNTGAALPEAQVAELRAVIAGLDVALMYGLTECKRVCVLDPREVDQRPGSVGRPLPGTTCTIVDPDGRPVPRGTAGELIVSGPHVMQGYWNAPELTAVRFRAGSDGRVWLHTGDRCRMDDDGYLYFLGRDDDIYKHRGFRVSTAEVESAALDVPGVEQVAVLPAKESVPPRMFVTGTVTAADVLAELRDRIEPYKVPDSCAVLDSLPLTPNGKIDKAALASQPPTVMR